MRVGYEWGADHLELVVSVIDNGPGIPAERMVSLFEPYTRGNHDAKVSGTGLGVKYRQEHRGRLRWANLVRKQSGRGQLFLRGPAHAI